MFESISHRGLTVIITLLGAGMAFGLRNHHPLRWKASASAVLHPLGCLGLFYSLAFYMHSRLGTWPKTIGLDGLPDDVLLHYDITAMTFAALIIGLLFVWPVAVLVCAVAPKMQAGLPYLGLYAVSAGVTFVAMELAPAPFLYWWWD
jgi:hypothetical protein